MRAVAALAAAILTWLLGGSEGNEAGGQPKAIGIVARFVLRDIGEIERPGAFMNGIVPRVFVEHPDQYKRDAAGGVGKGCRYTQWDRLGSIFGPGKYHHVADVAGMRSAFAKELIPILGHLSPLAGIEHLGINPNFERGRCPNVSNRDVKVEKDKRAIKFQS